jgi:endonuclease YncB( thermonuclease family)
MRRAACQALAIAVALALPAGPATAKASTFAHPPGPGTTGLIRGPARIVDGDTLEIRGVRIRLHGVDTPERGQTCTRARRRMDCYSAATKALEHLIGRSEILCAWVGDGGFGRAAARCWVGRTELVAWMVWAGWAIVARRYTQDPLHLRYEADARAERRGRRR